MLYEVIARSGEKPSSKMFKLQKFYIHTFLHTNSQK